MKLWPIALLVVFAMAFRGTARGIFTAGTVSDRAGAALQCEAPVMDDVLVLEQCLTLEPGDVELALDLGRAYESAGRWADAERVYRQALEADWRDGDLHLRLARLLLRRGDAGGARVAAGLALALQPGNPDARALVESGSAGGAGR